MLFHTRPPRALASDTALHSGLHSGLHHHQIDLLQEYPSLPPLPLPCSHQQHKRDHTHLSAWSSQQSIASMRKLFGQKIKTPKSASANDVYIAPLEVFLSPFLKQISSTPTHPHIRIPTIRRQQLHPMNAPRSLRITTYTRILPAPPPMTIGI